MPKVLMIIAQQEFRDEEYLEPKAILEGAGVNVITASVEAGPAKGKLGADATADISIRDANVGDYKAVIFIGGGGASIYFDDPTAHKLAMDARDRGKIVAAICIGPSILANAGLLVGKHATAYSSEENNLKKHGAQWTGKPVEIDGRIVTANGPAAAKDFGKAILDMLHR